MDKRFEIEKKLNDIDFSTGHEKAVWDKILSRLPQDSGRICIDDLDSIAGGLSRINENDSKDLHKK